MPQPPRTRREREPLDSDRFLRYLLTIVVTVAILLVAIAAAGIFLAM
jgi:hypothetical protein